MIDVFCDFVMNHGKLRAFAISAVIVFVFSAALFVVITAPFVAFGVVPCSAVFGGAVGCGIGSALSNGTICAINA